MRTVPFESLILAEPAPPLDRLGANRALLETPAFLPLEDGEAPLTYAPGVLRILPADGRGDFFSCEAHRRRANYAKVGCVFVASLALGLVGMLALVGLYYLDCGGILHPDYACEDTPILDETLFRVAAGFFAAGLLLETVLIVSINADGRAGKSASVALPPELMALLRRNQMRLEKIRAAPKKKPRRTLGGRAEQIGVEKAAKYTGKFVGGEVGEILFEAVAKTTLDEKGEDEHGKRQSRLSEILLKQSQARIAACHRMMSGRGPIPIAAAVFTKERVLERHVLLPAGRHGA